MIIGNHPGVKGPHGKKAEGYHHHDEKKVHGKKVDGVKKAAAAKKHIKHHEDDAKAGEINDAKKIHGGKYQDIKKAHDGKKPEIKKVKDDKKIKHIKPADHHPVAQKVVKKHHEVKKAHEGQAPAVKKLQEEQAVKPAVGVDQPQAADGVHIAKIVEVKDQAGLDLILQVTQQWAEKIKSVKKNLKDKDQLQVAKDAIEVTAGIKYLIEGDTIGGNMFAEYSLEAIRAGKRSIFAAYDNAGNIQGVSLVNLEGNTLCEYDNELDELMVNPERHQVLGHLPPFKGLGAQLVQEVAKKILHKAPRNKQNLGTCALLGSVGFYDKLGFEKECLARGGIDADMMVLKLVRAVHVITSIDGSGVDAYMMVLKANQLKALAEKV